MSRRDELPRFGRAARWAHRATGLLVLVLVATGLSLYLPALALLVGRRPLLEAAHVVAGLLLPLPTMLALASPAFRADLRALNRFVDADWIWLRRPDRRGATLAIGKFNAGQKLAAACFAAAGVVFFGTGLLLLFPDQLHLSDGLRQGATVVHDATTLALLALLAGHAYLAYARPESRRALRTGSMDRHYAEQHYPGWAPQVLPDEPPSARPGV
ncbi:MAG TPA: cytochrome b/b6 domain-containing protein [Mycobacteriales bacterium]|nr:cytochrome b/b6 domain-containing protein [Mycobacteriales bacterium]